MRTILIAFAATILLSSCDYLGGVRIDGNGKITTQQRTVGNFNSIEASGAVEVHIRQDSASSVKVETDENLQEYLEVYTDENTLVVKSKRGYNLDATKGLIVYVSAPQYANLEASGATKILGDAPVTGNALEMHVTGASEISMAINVTKLDAELSGASTLQLKGNSSSVSTEASGASNFKCLDLMTDETKLDLSGASDAAVTANKQLTIDASGASNVQYRGNASINQKTSGASGIRKVS